MRPLIYKFNIVFHSQAILHESRFNLLVHAAPSTLSCLQSSIINLPSAFTYSLFTSVLQLQQQPMPMQHATTTHFTLVDDEAWTISAQGLCWDKQLPSRHCEVKWAFGHFVPTILYLIGKSQTMTHVTNQYSQMTGTCFNYQVR